MLTIDGLRTQLVRQGLDEKEIKAWIDLIEYIRVKFIPVCGVFYEDLGLLLMVYGASALIDFDKNYDPMKNRSSTHEKLTEAFDRVRAEINATLDALESTTQ